MAETTGQEKTESASPRRRREARQEGNLARSTDLTAACMLLAAVVLLWAFGSRLWLALGATLRAMLLSSHAPNPTRADDLGAMVGYTGHVLAATLLPLLLVLASVGLLASIGQVGLLLTGKPIMPRFSKINPISGVKRLFDARAAMRLVMSVGKLVLIAGVAIIIIIMDLEKIGALPAMALRPGFALMAGMAFDLAIKLAAVLLILAILDFAFQKFQHEKDLRMTKQEVREEMKQMDGDPMMKQRRARVARQLAMQRMSQAVPKADVIITNPTHISIALQYDSETMRAPKVIAKGADLMAMQIRQIAAAHGIPLVERKPLARALYASAEVGDEVPEDHYAAVAEILAYVYRLSGRMAG